MVDPRDHDLLDRARLKAGLSMQALWVRYFELGGLAGILEVDGFLRGALIPPRLERDKIAHAINEASREKGGPDLVTYLFPG